MRGSCEDEAAVLQLPLRDAPTHRPRIAGEPFAVRPRAGTTSGDRQLLRAAALGDESAWEALVEAHAGAVWAACLGYGLRVDEAGAVSQLVWLSLAAAIPHLDLPLSTWLVEATAHEAHLAQLRAGGAVSRPARGGDRRRSPRTTPAVG